MKEFSSSDFRQGQLRINPCRWAKLCVVSFVWSLSGIDPKSSLWPLAVCKEGEEGALPLALTSLYGVMDDLWERRQRASVLTLLLL